MAKKRFVLDTNVLLHDPSVIYKFEDNVLVISPVVLEELDALKIQSRSVSADARQVIRLLDVLLDDVDPEVLRSQGIKRNEEGGLLVIPTLLSGSDLMSELANGNNDKRIIRDALLLQKMDTEKQPLTPSQISKTKAKGTDPGYLETIFVSKDINARLIARSAGLKSEDYKASQVKNESDEMATGFLTPNPDEVWNVPFECNEKEYRFDRKAMNDVLGVDVYPHLMIQMAEDEYLHIVEVTESSVIAIFRKESEAPDAYSIEPIGIRQAAALEVLADLDIPLIILTGTAGSGKTLLTLASGLQMKMEPNSKVFNKIIASRAANDLDKDIGFLPGTEEEKVSPWLGAIRDNIEVLYADADEGALESAVELTERHIQYRSINFMRGRSIQDSYFILDEAQNLTPHQIKTLVTRIGKGSKIVVLGDSTQIDNPFLSQYSSGLTYLIEKMKDSPLSAHIHLQGSPRSALSEDAGNRL